MRLLSWNIQWGRGRDGRVVLARIAEVLRAHDPDVVCLQELAVHHEGLPGAPQGNQPVQLAMLLPGYQWVYAPASDLPDGRGGRRQFGNLLLSRLPILQVLRHQLPWPADPCVPSMPRVALEASIEVPVVASGASVALGALRVVTTHLEFYSPIQRRAQVEHLRGIQENGYCGARNLPTSEDSDPPFAVLPRGEGAVFCGDFNCGPESDEYVRMQADLASDVPRLMDAWRLRHADQPHPPTAGLVSSPWLDKPVCFDFFFVSADLAGRVLDVWVDEGTEASDHQPILLTLTND
ncbi:MAG TPA: endonuclease/exonuclease/phosphatase family protein [Rhodocyclaceae bacterium]|nr:endonuclease/exonuclease/phosphatase family protein [Rhodocyclaceae bacterium]